jgi:hypothetical protein
MVIAIHYAAVNLVWIVFEFAAFVTCHVADNAIGYEQAGWTVDLFWSLNRYRLRKIVVGLTVKFELFQHLPFLFDFVELSDIIGD